MAADRANPRLADAQSPYLEEAATQSVDWYPWSEAAFEKAKAEGKPVLVDSGAVWCHWCHVMDHESYEDPETAELINERFVPIKLDRDERPDVDKRLQQAVGAITGRGGWPLTAFLTPDGEVFYGGTYFPREAQGGMPAFRQVLSQAATLYEEEPDKAREQAAKIHDALERTAPEPGEASREKLLASIDQALGAYDPANGGFGSQPKFPHPATADLLLWYAATHDDERAPSAREAALHTLEAMAQGGIYDHLAGGFHRYSVDAEWHVPHFEKMLYDNGPLLGAYARAAAVARTKGDEWARLLETAAEGTVRFLLEILEQPDGGFGGSQDADRRPQAEGPLSREELDDGGYFTWSLDEARAVLDDDELKIAKLHFGLNEDGDVRDAPGQNVLRIEATAEDIAEGTERSVEEVGALIQRVVEKLALARADRETPFIDPTVYADWNGLAITGLLAHDAHGGAPEAREAALAALDRLVEDAYDPDRGFLHAIGEDGQARVADLVDDQVQMLPALIEAYNATGEARHRATAREVGDLLLDRWMREDGQLRFNATEDEPAPDADQPTPAPATQAALHLPRLARLTGEERFDEAAERILEAVAGRSDRYGGVHGGTLHQAMLARIHEPAHVVVVGEGDAAEALHGAARSAPAFHTTILRVDDPHTEGVPAEAREAAKAFEGQTVAVVCHGERCQVAEDVDELRAQLAG